MGGWLCIDAAGDAVAALKLLEANAYDLLISDLGKRRRGQADQPDKKASLIGQIAGNRFQSVRAPIKGETSFWPVGLTSVFRSRQRLPRC